MRLMPGTVLAAAAVTVLGACGGSVKAKAAKSNVVGVVTNAATVPDGRSSLGLREYETVAAKGFQGDGDDEEPPTPNTENRDKDRDFDHDAADRHAEVYIDRDDGSIAGFGQAANPTEKRIVTALVKRFYRYARSDDGEAACRLEYSIFREAIPEDYGPQQGMPYATGKTCAEVLTKVFRHNRREAHLDYEVTAVRVKGKYGFVLLGSKTAPAAYVNLQRERGKWRIVGLLAGTLA